MKHNPKHTHKGCRRLPRRSVSILMLLLLVGCDSRSTAPFAPASAPQAASALPVQPNPVQAPLPCPDAPGPLDGAIAFSAGGNIMVMRADGSGVAQLTKLPNTALAHDPSWSPDTQTLAFTLTQPSADPNLTWLQVGTICGMERATGKGRTLGRGANINDSLGEASWTPDGKILLVNTLQPQFDAIGNYASNKLSIGRYNLAMNTLQPLVPDAISPALSLDGRRLTYLHLDPQTGKTTLAVAQADGSGVQMIGQTAQFLSLATPRWSPDGKQIVFTASGTLAPSGSKQPERTLIEWLLGIKVAAAHGTPADVWLADANTLALRQITRKGLDDPRATWAPNGQLIYTDNSNSGSGTIRLLDPQTGNEQQLTKQTNFLGITWVAH